VIKLRAVFTLALDSGESQLYALATFRAGEEPTLSTERDRAGFSVGLRLAVVKWVRLGLVCDVPTAPNHLSHSLHTISSVVSLTL
jgi:hypothetical protein